MKWFQCLETQRSDWCASWLLGPIRVCSPLREIGTEHGRALGGLFPRFCQPEHLYVPREGSDSSSCEKGTEALKS